MDFVVVVDSCSPKFSVLVVVFSACPESWLYLLASSILLYFTDSTPLFSAKSTITNDGIFDVEFINLSIPWTKPSFFSFFRDGTPEVYET